MPTKILAIDDSKTMRLAIKITFAAEDAKVTAVSKGSEAVARAKQMKADVVLVDHTLAQGEPSGFEVVQALKSNPATAKIPVLMLIPAKNSPISEADVSAAGADGFIGKPFDTAQLIEKVNTAIAGGARIPAAAPAARKPAAAPAARKPAAPPASRKPAAPPATRKPAAPPA
ncbi:response regulator, partial [Plesiocystis pacifica SIR-1]